MRVLSRLLSGLSNRPPPQPNRPLWVVGDIHGRADLLDLLLAKISDHPVSSGESDLVFVGDYVDRGDDSAGVLRRLFAISREVPNTVFLKGNHEDMMLQFLEAPNSRAERWLHFGGTQTLGSFGISAGVFVNGDNGLRDLAVSFQDALPPGTESWLRALPVSWTSGTVTVCHAGADPGIPIEDQEENTFVWGHPDFLRRDRTDETWIAYGHTITKRPGSDGRGRVAVDTGAFHSGILSAALILPDGNVEIVQAS